MNDNFMAKYEKEFPVLIDDFFWAMRGTCSKKNKEDFYFVFRNL